MASIYHYNQSPTNEGAELFRDGINVLTCVKIPFLETLLASENLAVITELSMQNNEVIQFFLTFDDAISWFYFGKGLGSLSLRGLLLTCDEGTPGLPILLNDVMEKTRGQLVEISLGNTVFRCVMTSFNLSLSQDPSPVVEFNLALNIVGHTLPVRDNREAFPCTYNPIFDNMLTSDDVVV